jgi:hypothetical protein
MIVRTAGCAPHDHPEITVVFRDEPVAASAARWLVEHFQDIVADGVRLSPGDAVRLGMRTVRMIARDDGTLGVEERVGTDVWEEHVDRTMTDLWYQGAAAAELGLPEELSSTHDDDLVVVRPCSRGASKVVLNRVRPDDPQSFGWVIACGDDHEHVDWVLSDLFHVGLAVPHLNQFFARPVGVMISIDNGRVAPNGGVWADVFYDDAALTPSGGARFGPDPVVSVAHAAVLKLDDGTYRTSIGAHVDHPDVTIRLAEPLVPDLQDPLAQWLLDYLQDAISGGARFLPGQTVGVGWRTLRVVERSDGLGLEERVDDGGWEEHVHLTLRDMWYQKEVVASIDAMHRLSFPSEAQSAEVSGCVAGAPLAVLLTRSASDDPSVSGWTVSCARDHDHGDTIAEPLVDLVASMPFAMQLLALPVGASVVVDSPGATTTGRIGVRISLDGRPVEPLPGSYLEALRA